jgi:hypothetical protein
MSGRQRIVKRRIRAAEQEIARLDNLLGCYEVVMTDGMVSADTVRELFDCGVSIRNAMYLQSRVLEREQDLLASMPKRLHGDDYDPGDEQQHRDEKKKVRAT